MEAGVRIFFDISFTRTQQGAVGITRTVRRLLDHLREGGPDRIACIPVVFHSKGYRIAPSEASGAAPSDPRPVDSPAARLLQQLEASPLRRRIMNALPLFVVRAAWRVYSRLTFDALARGLQPVQFRPGDVLLLCDASWNYRAWVATRAAQRAGARVVPMVHDLIPVRHPEYGAPLLTWTFRRWLARMTRSADAIVCNSAATAEDLRAYAREQAWALPPVGHFRLGSDIAARAQAGAVRPELSRMTADAARCFAAVGSIESRKNYATLLAAFEQLWDRGEDVRLVLLGRRTAECAELAARIASHPENGRRFLAVFDAADAEVDYVYANSRALVFPSLAEGFGLPLVEARSRGALVIASDIPVFRELADEGVLLFPRRSPEELAARVLQVVAWKGRAAVPPMQPFTWAQSASQLLSVTQALLRPLA